MGEWATGEEALMVHCEHQTPQRTGWAAHLHGNVGEVTQLDGSFSLGHFEYFGH